MNTVTKTATIANGASLSGAVELDGSSVVGIVMPAAWTTANLTFQGSADDSTFDDVYDDTGTEKNVPAAASRFIQLNPADWIGASSIKIRSGTSATPVNQGGARSIGIVIFVP